MPPRRALSRPTFADVNWGVVAAALAVVGGCDGPEKQEQCGTGAVYDGDVTLYHASRQEDYTCTKEITGDLDISNVDGLSNLDGFASLETVGGSISIADNADLQSLQGLGRLRSVGSSLELRGNPELSTLEGLGALETVGNVLALSDNAQLQSLEGLDSLSTVADSIELTDTQLTDLGGLPAMETVAYVLLRSNRHLQDVSKASDWNSQGIELYANAGLERVTLDASGLRAIAVSRNIGLVELNVAAPDLEAAYVEANTELEEVRLTSGLASWTEVEIEDNAVLQTLELEGAVSVDEVMLLQNTSLSTVLAPSLTSVTGSLYVDGAAATALDGLPELVSVGSLDVSNCPNLTELGPPSLSTISGDLSIRWNASLRTLAGFDSLATVGGDLLIYNNSVMDALGLDALASVDGSVEIHDNAALCAEDVDALVGQLTTEPASVDNSGNAGACP